MARGKKKESNLTPEEKLAQALVPEGKQPYQVPGNWCWAYLLRGAAECMDSFRKPVNATERAEREGDIPYYGATGQVGWIDDFLTDEELVLLGEDGAPFLDPIKDKAYLIIGKAWVNNHAHILRSYYGSVGNKYLVNYLNSFNYKGYVNGTTRLKLTQASMHIMPVPIPPIAEQQRIVDRIEYLFDKLDEAKEKAQSVLDSFETRKAAILHKAFTGELTTEWKMRNSQFATAWTECKLLDALIEKPRNGYSPKPVDYETRYKSMTLSATTSGYFRPEFYKYIDEEIPEDSYLWLKPGDILMQRANSLEKVGTSALYTGKEKDFIYPDLMMKLQVKNGVSAHYVAYWLKSESALLYLRSNATGTAGNMPKINQKVVSELPIRIPSLQEQEEIVRILDSLFAKEQQAKEASEAVLEKIDLLKKSILARAFRGELGTNDPGEENAEELIKKHLSEKIREEKPKRKRNIKQPEVEFVVKTIMQVLSAGTKVTPEKLKAETGLEIDDFYDQLKALINSGRVIETRMDGESYLEAKNEDRQPSN